jgi:hypothetical protein
MNTSATNHHSGAPAGIVDALRDDVDGPMEALAFGVAERLHFADGEAPLDALATLSLDEITELLTTRMLVERAKGALMVIYEIDADEAFELLEWHSQAADVELRLLASELLKGIPDMTGGFHLGLGAACDNRLFIASERVRATQALP